MPENENINETNVSSEGYQPYEWGSGEVISVANLMHIENGISSLNEFLNNLQIVAMTGATDSTDGVAGYVPQPKTASEDYNKFLRGNGTWSNDGSTLVSLNADQITTGTLGAARLGDNSIPGTKITAGTITTDQLSSDGVLGTLKSGTIPAEYIGDIPATQIVVESGSTLDPTTLPVFGLNTSGIVAAPASRIGGFLKDDATWGIPYRTQTVTLETFVNNICTVQVNGLTINDVVVISPAPSSLQDYISYGIYCSNQANGALEFTASSDPENTTFSVNVIIMQG